MKKNCIDISLKKQTPVTTQSTVRAAFSNHLLCTEKVPYVTLTFSIYQCY